MRRSRDKQLLVVLDNCEHLVEAVAALVDAVVDACPGIRVLATSREALGVEGEATFQLRPLPTPAEHGDGAPAVLLDNDAVRLFVERAQMVKRGFVLSEASAPVVAEICRRLDGIPLAIELAAARVASLGPADILRRLDERFRLLAGGDAPALERHQTLRGAIDWSYGLLDPAEQLALRSAVGVRGRVHARGSRGRRLGRRVDVLTLLASLVAKSMVVTDDTETGIRYRLLETLRDYAAERLGELDDPAAARARHTAHFLAEVEATGPMLRGADDQAGVARLAAEQDNLRAALGRARVQPDPATFVRLLRGLGFYWTVVGDFRETAQWLDPAGLERAAGFPAEVRAELLLGGGQGEQPSSDIDDEGDPSPRGEHRLSHDAGLPPPIPNALSMLSMTALESNHPEEAITRCEEAVAAAHELGDSYAELYALNTCSPLCAASPTLSAGGPSPTKWWQVPGGSGAATCSGLRSRLPASPGSAVSRSSRFDCSKRPNRPSPPATPSCGANPRSSVASRTSGSARSPKPRAALRVALRLTQALGSDYFSANVINVSAAILARTRTRRRGPAPGGPRTGPGRVGHRGGARRRRVPARHPALGSSS